KDCPSADRADGSDFVTPWLFTMVMASLLHAGSLIEPVCPLPVVNDPEKFTVPKFASGRTVHRMKQLDGASATHSAEVLTAELTVWVVEKVAPVVTFVRVTVNEVPFPTTSAEIVSPAWIVTDVILNEGFG